MEMPGYRDDVLAVLADILEGRPDVRRGAMFGMPGFFVGRKLFACCWDAGVGLKLPAARVAALRESDPQADSFGPGGRVMKEWIYLFRGDAEAFRRDAALIEESIAFVAGGAT